MQEFLETLDRLQQGFSIQPQPKDTIPGSSMPATLLLIDDNAVQAATRQTILKRQGYFVVVTLSPSRALEQLRNGEFAEPIDLIITDHIMPDMNGVEFVRAVRAFAPTIPVLVISGLVEAEEEYADLNVNFRLKPLLPDHLIASVHTLLKPPPPRQE
jgi:CheY-like chemotaxis protein